MHTNIMYMVLIVFYCIVNEQVTDNSESLLPDTNTVNIPRTSLTNMNKIGAGKDVYMYMYIHVHVYV